MSSGLIAAGAATILLPAMQAQWHHQEERSYSVLFRRREMDQAKMQHEQRMGLNATQFKELATMTRSMHSERMGLIHELARRETARDVWLQRFSINDTMIVMSGLMFGCAAMNLGQSTFQPTLSPALIVVHAVSLGVAVLALGVAVWVCFVLQVRLGGFSLTDQTVVYSCGRKHAHFNEFYACHCDHLRQIAKAGFTLGSLMVLLTAVVVLYPQWADEHSSEACVIWMSCCIGIGLLAVIVGEKVWPSRTHDFAYDFGGLSQVTVEAQKTT